jgi:hypothetical protein
MTKAVTSLRVPSGGADRHSSHNVRRAVTLSVVGAATALAILGSTAPAFAASSGGPSAPAGGEGRFPGASGTIAAINGTSLEVQNAQTGQTTVTYTPTTTFQQTVNAKASALSVGSCITATGKPSKKAAKKSSTKTATQSFGEPVTATVVSITEPTAGSCTSGFGGAGGAGAGRFPRTGGSPTGANGGAPGGQHPTGGFRGRAGGQFAAASGPVTRVAGSKVTIKETDPRTKKSLSVVVTLSSSTTFSERQSAAATDLAVGKCASSFGSADSTGAVTASSITISSPGANGCTTGFGGFGGRAAGGAPGGPAGA